MGFEPIFYMPVDAIIAALGQHAVTAGLTVRSSDPSPAKSALKLALGLAIKEYATQDNAQVLAKALGGRNGILNQDDVAAEFARALVEDEPMDAELIGRVWRERIKDPSDKIDFTEEARKLIGHFLGQRRWVSDVRDILALRKIELTAEAAAALAAQAAAIEGDLAHLMRMLDGWGFLPVRRLQHLRYDQTAFVEEHTRDFVGRAFALATISRFIGDTGGQGGVFFTVAEPGVGKTALMAKLARERNCVHHFNRRPAGGPTSKRQLLGNLCAQVIAKYDLESRDLPESATEDSSYLASLLVQASRREQGGPILIVIDSADEMDDPRAAATVIHCQESAAYFFVSTRPGFLGALPNELRGATLHQEELHIDPLGETNLADIREYIGRHLHMDGIQHYINQQHLTERAFIEELLGRSEGNFMYLRHTLPAIARGALHRREASQLPQGLIGYYADHVQQMEGTNPAAWTTVQLPVLAVLSFLHRPLTITQIARMATIPPEKVAQVLRQWSQFLKSETVVLTDGRRRAAFSIYHASFQEYLADNPHVRTYRELVEDGVGNNFGSG